MAPKSNPCRDLLLDLESKVQRLVFLGFYLPVKGAPMKPKSNPTLTLELESKGSKRTAEELELARMAMEVDVEFAKEAGGLEYKLVDCWFDPKTENMIASISAAGEAFAVSKHIDELIAGYRKRLN